MDFFQCAALLKLDLESHDESDWEPTEADLERMRKFQAVSEEHADITQQVMRQMGIRTQ
jgi:hypothetical protein